MIIFNELRISPDSAYLIIDASVKSLSYYDMVYIDTIKIDTQDTYSQGGPSSSVVYSYTVSEDSKNIRLELGIGDILPSLKDNLFFVYVTTKGTPSMDTPCGADSMITLGVAVNLYPIFQYNFAYIREIESECKIPKGFIDAILRLKAFELSLKTGNYVQAIKYWNKFFKNLKSPIITRKCNCGYE